VFDERNRASRDPRRAIETFDPEAVESIQDRCPAFPLFTER
jgi:hypothetical protein